MANDYKEESGLISKLILGKHVVPASIPSGIFSEKTYLDIVAPYNALIAIGVASGVRQYPNPLDFSIYQKMNVLDADISLTLHAYIALFEKRLRSFVIGSFCRRLVAAGYVSCGDPSVFSPYLSGTQVFDFFSATDYSLWQAYWSQSLANLSRARPASAVQELQRRKKKLTKDRKSAITKLIACFGPHPQNSSSLAKHYKAKYHCVPAFAGMHNLSLGTTAILFGMLPLDDQRKFWVSYTRRATSNYSTVDLAKFLIRLKRICDIRNRVNHYEPIIPLFFESTLATMNSLAAIISRLSRNYQMSCFGPSYQKPSLMIPVNSTSFNRDKYTILRTMINSL
jgi:hypothetical protein